MKTSVARLAAIAAVAAALAGCSAINPITTQDRYAPSDGVQVEMGDAKALNLLVVTTAQDAPAVLTGTLYNGGAGDLAVTLSIDGTLVTNVTVPARSSARLGAGDGETLVQGASPAAPGGIADVWIGTTDDGPSQVPVPVVDGTHDEYQGVVDAIPPLPSPSPTA